MTSSVSCVTLMPGAAGSVAPSSEQCRGLASRDGLRAGVSHDFVEASGRYGAGDHPGLGRERQRLLHSSQPARDSCRHLRRGRGRGVYGVGAQADSRASSPNGESHSVLAAAGPCTVKRCADCSLDARKRLEQATLARASGMSRGRKVRDRESTPVCELRSANVEDTRSQNGLVTVRLCSTRGQDSRTFKTRRITEQHSFCAEPERQCGGGATAADHPRDETCARSRPTISGAERGLSRKRESGSPLSRNQRPAARSDCACSSSCSLFLRSLMAEISRIQRRRSACSIVRTASAPQ